MTNNHNDDETQRAFEVPMLLPHPTPSSPCRLVILTALRILYGLAADHSVVAPT